MSTTATATTNDSHRATAAVTTRLIAGTATEVRTEARQHTFTIDEPADLGGTDRGATPVEHLLAALGACQVITFQVWADKLGIALDSVEIALEGDLDLRGFFGLDPDVRPGFETIRVAVTIAGPETKDRYAQLIDTVERHCPVLDNLSTTVPVETTVTVAA